MGAVDKTLDTAGGTIVGGAKGVAAGFLAPIAIGAVIAAAAVFGVAALAGGAAALLTAPTLIGAGVAALLGGAFGGSVGSIPMATIGGAIGGLMGGGKKLFSGKAEPEPQIDQLLAAERERSKALTAQLVERQQAAASFDNDVKGNMAPKVQAQQAAAQQQGATVG